MKLTNKELRKIFHSITYGVGNHGSFLRNLAGTAVSADSENFEILAPALEQIVIKYDLNNKPYIEND